MATNTVLDHINQTQSNHNDMVSPKTTLSQLTYLTIDLLTTSNTHRNWAHEF